MLLVHQRHVLTVFFNARIVPKKQLPYLRQWQEERTIFSWLVFVYQLMFHVFSLVFQVAHGPSDAVGETTANFAPVAKCWRCPGHSIHAGIPQFTWVCHIRVGPSLSMPTALLLRLCKTWFGISSQNNGCNFELQVTALHFIGEKAEDQRMRLKIFYSHPASY